MSNAFSLNLPTIQNFTLFQKIKKDYRIPCIQDVVCKSVDGLSKSVAGRFLGGALCSLGTLGTSYGVTKVAVRGMRLILPNNDLNTCVIIQDMAKIAAQWFKVSQSTACYLVGLWAATGGPVLEELVFRGCIQDLLFLKTIQLIRRTISHKQAFYVETKAEKLMRIVFTSFLFGLVHLNSPDGLSKDRVYLLRFFPTFAIGCFLGAIKESKMGIAGAVGCHVAHNTLLFIFSNICTTCASRS